MWHVFHQLLLALGECHRKRTGVHKVHMKQECFKFYPHSLPTLTLPSSLPSLPLPFSLLSPPSPFFCPSLPFSFSLQVLHRDLKPANVFLDGNNNVKLGDFGLARILHHNFSLAKTFVGTPYYMSPVSLPPSLPPSLLSPFLPLILRNS